MQFCHISPVAYLNKLNIQRYSNHLLLAHLVEENEEYVKFYAENKLGHKTYILDNSAFELYRQNKPMFDGAKLIDLAKKVTADYIVLPDYPGEAGAKTIAAAGEFIPIFKEAGYKTFFVPQSKIGDLEDYIACFAWAASNPGIDYIGMSILGIPNAFGVDGNDIQRFYSRRYMFDILAERGLVQLAKNLGKKIHCLGMTDGPREIRLLQPYINAGTIDSWDSSAAVWAGIEGIRFDTSPTGLVNGKVKSHVDFNRPLDESRLSDIAYNINQIDTQVSAWSPTVDQTGTRQDN